MALTFHGIGAVAQFTTVDHVRVFTPASLQALDLIVVPIAFEGVGAGSGPWVTFVDAGGWARVGYADPAGTGVGLEVWWATWTTGTYTDFYFGVNRSGVTREGSWRCDSAVETVPDGAASATATGDDPVCPDVTAARPQTLVLRVVGQKCASPGIDWPASVTQRVDNTRAGFGTAELSYADAAQAAPGAAGTITTTATASPAGSEGSTMSIVFGCTDTRITLPFLGVGP